MQAKFIFESITDKVRLYRGDSTFINSFDSSKFDPKAIYGPGLYLTDNPRVAYTYTLKGDHSSIITRDIYAGSNKQRDAVLCFIIEYLVNQVNNTHFSDDELHDVYKTIQYNEYNIGGKEMMTRYLQGDKLFWVHKDRLIKLSDDEYQKELNSEFTKDTTQRMKDKIKKLNIIHKKYDPYILKATEYYKEHAKEYDFLYDGSESWDVVYKPKNAGKISEFEVDKEAINQCYYANEPMNKEVLAIVRKMINHWLKGDKMVEYVKELYWLKDKYNFKYFLTYVYNYHDNPNVSLSRFLYDNRVFRSTESHLDLNDWKIFITEMKKLGYNGIIYDGGEHLQSPIKHKAYVIWNLADVNRIK